MMAAAGAAGWLVTTEILEPPQQPPQQFQAAAASVPQQPQQPQQIQRAGQVTSSSPQSVTMVGADGQSTTFRITPETAQIGLPGVMPRNVVVHGVIRDGVAVATAIADREAIGPDGPPMDYGLPV
ncbi:hypothetical protein MPP7335_00721 [Mycolicibacterium parafortuitum]|uniref:Uncharacterized protein n=2 Tax=Mycolicibacterium parafortuitum TaxID=39692 RepID=A0A375YD50_MYCPF|nr:hypothetical protein MPP7335_00721 [Mycolicibacterium parafortuitum]